MFKEQYPQDLSSIPHIGLKPNPAQSDLLSPPTAKVLPEKTHISVSNLVLPRFISFPFAQPYISTEYITVLVNSMSKSGKLRLTGPTSPGGTCCGMLYGSSTQLVSRRKNLVPNMKGVAAGCDSWAR